MVPPPLLLISMQFPDYFPSPDTIQLQCLTDCEDEMEQVVVIELLVPVAAKVPAARQLVQAAKPVRQASVTSTVCGKSLTPLKANNTALTAGWCFTATLAAPSRSHPASSC